jgi:hypothetical protein
MKMEWIPIDPNKPMPKLPCLVWNSYNSVDIAETAREFWDSNKYWFPMPSFPFPVQGFASDEAAMALLRGKR